MLGNIDLADKTYEELMAQAIELIPLYSDEWTNFNQSDPGITVLENLSAFTMLQQTRVNEITEAVRRRLFELLGYEAGKYNPARVYLKEERNRSASLIAGEKLMAGGLCFETDEAVNLSSWGITAAYTERDGVYKDITYLLDGNSKTRINVFGASVKNQSSLCLVFDKPLQDELIIYIKASGEAQRNTFDSDINFADLKWQYYTEGGWVDVEFADETRGFLLSGTVRLTLPGITGIPAEFTDVPEKGYAVRCVLVNGRYDIPPRISSIAVNLFEVVQKDTKAKSFIFHGAKNVEINHRMAQFGYFAVYGREGRKGPYRAYKAFNPYSKDEQGRYYTIEKMQDGGLRFDFDKKRFGFAPGQGFGSVRVICYNNDTIHHYKLGRVEGYENQIIDIEQIERVLPEKFCVLVESHFESDETGEAGYYFIEPELTNPDYLCYSVLSEKGQIIIKEPGLVEDCYLYISDCVVTEGVNGNIISSNHFLPYTSQETEQSENGVVFVNPAAGKGGTSVETPEQMRLRLLSDIKSTTCAVTVEDYENLALNTPGFCIHKAKAVFNQEENTVRVAVKPYSLKAKQPKLSAVHLEHIGKYLNSRRMITTNVEIRQPVYIAVDVHATIYVKSYFGDARPVIEEYLTKALDGVETDVPFGARLSYHKLFNGLEALECVDSLYELGIIARDRINAKTIGSDIQLNGESLYHAGSITLEIITKY
ncbi:MAG: baseplate J/gp47 family protein [Oscillospiraceae bacterium]|nr:baseplate J/gp47 family protein [Oscillospiraceae bacterium]